MSKLTDCEIKQLLERAVRAQEAVPALDQLRAFACGLIANLPEHSHGEAVKFVAKLSERIESALVSTGDTIFTRNDFDG